MPEIIEGRWDDLINRQDMKGRQVRVVVLGADQNGESDPWLESLRDWAESHQSLAHRADDSRESIYPGTVDDSR